MEVLAALFIWPFLILAIFLAGLSFAFFDASYLVLLIIFAIILFAIFRPKGDTDTTLVKETPAEQLQRVRQIAIVFCISVFLPLFARYLISGMTQPGATTGSLPAVIVALAVGFGILLWGLFTKRSKTLLYSNLIGGGLTIMYCYFEIWTLGSFARVIATAFGLVVAVAFSIIKLKEKLK